MQGSLPIWLRNCNMCKNSAARVLTYTPPRSHITPVLSQLHWLPVQSRIDFKVIFLTYKAVHGLAPEYICNLVTVSTPSRSLQSACSITLYQPRCKLKTMGGKSFSCIAPRLWNSLPPPIRNAPSFDCFKKLLKTYIFGDVFKLKSYSCCCHCWYCVVSFIAVLYYCSTLSVRNVHYKNNLLLLLLQYNGFALFMLLPISPSEILMHNSHRNYFQTNQLSVELCRELSIEMTGFYSYFL